MSVSSASTTSSTTTSSTTTSTSITTTSSTGTSVSSTTKVGVMLMPHLLLQHGLTWVISQFCTSRLRPRMMSKLLTHQLQLSDPSSNILSPIIVILALFDRVKLSRTPWIIANACNILPIGPVGVGIVIDQPSFEKFRSVSPVPAEILCEKGCYVLSSSIAHEPGLNELDHVGIDHGHTCFCCCPPNKRVSLVTE